MIITLIITLVLSLGFAWLSRMAGGASPKLPSGLDQWFYAVPYGIVAFLALTVTTSGTIYDPYPWWIWVGTALAYFGAFLGKRTGHGQWMDLGFATKIVKPEKLDFLVTLIFGKDKNTKVEGKGDYWRDFTGLAVSGLAVSLIAGLIVGYFLSVVLGTLILLGGAMKSVAYVIGWGVNKGNYRAEQPSLFGEQLDDSTEIGEFLTGFFGGLPVFFTILTILL